MRTRTGSGGEACARPVSAVRGGLRAGRIHSKSFTSIPSHHCCGLCHAGMPFVQPRRRQPRSRRCVSSELARDGARSAVAARRPARGGIVPRTSRLVSGSTAGARIPPVLRFLFANQEGNFEIQEALFVYSCSRRPCALACCAAQDTTELLNRMKAMEDRIKALEAEVQSLKAQPPATAAAALRPLPRPLRRPCRPRRRPRSRRKRWPARAPRRNSAARAAPRPRR